MLLAAERCVGPRAPLPQSPVSSGPAGGAGSWCAPERLGRQSTAAGVPATALVPCVPTPCVECPLSEGRAPCYVRKLSAQSLPSRAAIPPARLNSVASYYSYVGCTVCGCSNSERVTCQLRGLRRILFLRVPVHYNRPIGPVPG